MNNKKLFIYILTLLLMGFSSKNILAKDNNKYQNRLDETEYRLEDKAKPDESLEKDENEDKNTQELENDSEDEEELKASQQTFELKGIITSLGDNSLGVNGQTIIIDKTIVKNIELNGELKLGDTVKVEGIIIDQTKYAKEIDTFPNMSASPSPSIQPSPSPSSQSLNIQSYLNPNFPNLYLKNNHGLKLGIIKQFNRFLILWQNMLNKLQA